MDKIFLHKHTHNPKLLSASNIGVLCKFCFEERLSTTDLKRRSGENIYHSTNLGLQTGRDL